MNRGTWQATVHEVTRVGDSLAIKQQQTTILQSRCIKKKLSSGHRARKGQFSFQSQRKTMPKNAQTTAQLHSSHTLVKSCSKFSKPGFSRKGRGTRDQIANIYWIIKKARVPEKHLFVLLTIPKPLTVWVTINCGTFFKRWEYHTT